MEKFRKKVSLWFYRNNQKGIPNLMLYIAIGNVIIWFMSMIDPSNILYSLLCFDRDAILHGQVWRVFSYIFTYLLDATGMGTMLSFISLLCYFFIGRTLEQYWGILRFNCYYLTGILLMDIPCMLCGFIATTYYLNLSLFLAIATIIPETRFYIFYIIPVKAKYLAWFYMFITITSMLSVLVQVILAGASLIYYIYAFLPVIALLNYILFFGKDIVNILPDFMRYSNSKTQRSFRAAQRPSPSWSANYSNSTGEKPYRHKCTVCGKTDVSDPQLEFRYCSKCCGFHCYCNDHINNHIHIAADN